MSKECEVFIILLNFKCYISIQCEVESSHMEAFHNCESDLMITGIKEDVLEHFDRTEEKSQSLKMT